MLTLEALFRPLLAAAVSATMNWRVWAAMFCCWPAAWFPARSGRQGGGQLWGCSPCSSPRWPGYGQHLAARAGRARSRPGGAGQGDPGRFSHGPFWRLWRVIRYDAGLGLGLDGCGAIWLRSEPALLPAGPASLARHASARIRLRPSSMGAATLLPWETAAAPGSWRWAAR